MGKTQHAGQVHAHHSYSHVTMFLLTRPTVSKPMLGGGSATAHPSCFMTAAATFHTHTPLMRLDLFIRLVITSVELSPLVTRFNDQWRFCSQPGLETNEVCEYFHVQRITVWQNYLHWRLVTSPSTFLLVTKYGDYSLYSLVPQYLADYIHCIADFNPHRPLCS